VGGGEWQHAKLHNTGHIAGTGTPALVTAGLVNEDIPFEPSGNPAVGAFIYRSEDGFGTFSTTANKLRWNYAAQGITNATTLEVNVYAIEMVYVPEGEFNVGGGGGQNAFTSTTINTANATIAPSGTGSLGGQAGGYPTGVTPPASPNWPNGYAAFYCMKYEISQQQYVDFLNCLTLDQAINRCTTNMSSERYSLYIGSQGYYVTDLPNLPCILSFDDGRAYSHWSALRVMTELEYEKSCRGVIAAVGGEYSWGSSLVQSGSYLLSNINLENEEISGNYGLLLGNSNKEYPNYFQGEPIMGLLRVGIFAANGANSGRISSGASYWGVMELTGNAIEQCLLLTDQMASQFDGKHGDGILSPMGDSNLFQASEVGHKGGCWYCGPRPVSQREFYPYTNWRFQALGFRSVRGL
jgi:formylglycine-generating enzyme required for sulfatase activity